MLFQRLLSGFRSSLLNPRFLLLRFLSFVLLLSSLGFYVFEKGSHENLSFADALWWSLVTMTTVGYGDLYPQTLAGRFLVGVPTMMLGIAVLAILLERVQTNITQTSRKERGLIPMTKDHHVLILGFPGVAQMNQIISEIRMEEELKTAALCFITDKIQENPDSLSDRGVHFIHGKPSSEEALEKANLRQASKVIILADNAQDSDLDGITLMRILNVKRVLSEKEVYVLAECLDLKNEQLMIQAGADEIIAVNSLSAGLIVQGITSKGINLVLRDLISNKVGFQFYIQEVPRDLPPIAFKLFCQQVEEKFTNVRPIGVLNVDRQLTLEDDFVLSSTMQVLYISEKRQNLWKT
jgi:voltage-gated potassium channel